MHPTTATRPARIPLPGRLSAEAVARLNALNAAQDAQDAAEARQDYVSQPSRFVGVQSGLPSHTTI